MHGCYPRVTYGVSKNVLLCHKHFIDGIQTLCRLAVRVVSFAVPPLRRLYCHPTKTKNTMQHGFGMSPKSNVFTNNFRLNSNTLHPLVTYGVSKIYCYFSHSDFSIGYLRCLQNLLLLFTFRFFRWPQTHCSLYGLAVHVASFAAWRCGGHPP